MTNSEDYINSGILELYVLGHTSPDETEEILRLAASDKLIRKEISEIELAIEEYSLAHAVEPDPIIRPFLLASIDYMDRVQGGEPVKVTPMLSSESKITDYSEWLDRDDMILPQDFDDVFARILTYTPEIICAIVWIREMAPQEVHDNEFEKFFILEGTCIITVEGVENHLSPGDYFEIPLHKKHHVSVTSSIPCKVILQRVAA